MSEICEVLQMLKLEANKKKPPVWH